jgi:hypothetical protein
MRLRNILLIGAFASVGLIFGLVSLSEASSIDACGSECETSSACKGIRGKSNGNPVGCSSSCGGNCEVCKNGTSTDFCKYTGDSNDVCISDTSQWTDCADTYEASCTGTSQPCGCSSTMSYEDDNCNIHFCAE